MILIVSTPSDDHALAVIERLAGMRGETYLLDLSRFPRELKLNVTYGPNNDHRYRLTDNSTEALYLSEVNAIWWRRPQPFVIDPEVSSPVNQSFAQEESFSAFSGLWLCADASWLNHPTADDEASRKVYQLKIAQEVGLEIPTTIITNDPGAARDFILQSGPDHTVYKAFSGTEHAWRETRLIAPDEVELLPSVSYAPVIFQEYVPASVDLRVTVVGERVFTAAIYSQESAYKVDYRMDMDRSRVEVLSLPAKVEKNLKSLMRRLKLTYGAIDMRITPEGRVIFLEINPSGQWLFIEERTGLEITAAVAALLERMDRTRPRVGQQNWG